MIDLKFLREKIKIVNRTLEQIPGSEITVSRRK